MENLENIELSILLGILTRQPIIIESEKEHSERVCNLVVRACRETFPLGSVVCVGLSHLQTTDMIGAYLLVEKDRKIYEPKSYTLDSQLCLANVIILPGLDRASDEFQLYMLQLIHDKFVYVNGVQYPVPEDILVIGITSNPYHGHRLHRLIKENFIMSHRITGQDELDNLELQLSGRKPISSKDIDERIKLMNSVKIHHDIIRYINDIIAYLRAHKCIEPGIISAGSKMHLINLVKGLASIHGQGFTTPNLVRTAVRKVYRHRITGNAESDLASTENNKGTRNELPVELIQDGVIEDTIKAVEVPI